MKRVAFWLSLSFAGCAGEPWLRAAPAALVPALDLRVAYRRARELGLREGDRNGVAIAAFLRWAPRNAASAIPSQAEQAPSAWLAPCALDDVICLAELAEAEAEIAAALRAAP